MRSAPEHGPVGCINPCQVFIRNLPTEFLEKDLASLAEEYGPIKRVDLVKSSQTKESRGFGFIKFALEDDARKAVNGLEGKIVLGKKVRAEIARRKGAKHAAKEGGNGKKVENHENGKNALLHENIVNTTTAGKKEDTVRTTVKEGCEGTSANTTTIHVPERVRTAVLFGIPSNITKKQLFKRVRKGRMQPPLLPQGIIATVLCETKTGTKELVSNVNGRIIKGSKVYARFLPGLSIGEGHNTKKKRLIVRNLPWDTTEADLGDIFVTWGPLTEVKIPKVEVSFKRNGEMVSRKQSRGFGFVQYFCVADAERVVKDHGIVNVKGRPTAVDFVISLRSTKENGDERQQVEKEEEETDVDTGDMVTDEKEELEGKNSQSIVGSTELIRHSKGSCDKESIQDTEEDDDDDEEENKEEYNKEQTIPQSNQQQFKHERISDVSHGLTVFVRNLPFDADAKSIHELFTQFGAIAYSLPTVDKQTGLRKGTAFVKYRLKQGLEACLEAASSYQGIQLAGRELVISKAIDRDQAACINEQKSKPTQVDRRFLYLANEGLLIPDSQAAKETPPEDMEKRARARSEKKQKLKSPLFFINPQRLSIRNISPRVSDDELRKVCLDAAEKGVAAKLVGPEDEKRHLKAAATPATKVTPERLRIPPVTRTSTTRCRIMRDMERKPDKESGLYPSRGGYGFADFKYHVHALATLRYLNNNPILSYLAKGGGAPGKKRKKSERDGSISNSPRPRLIVEFTVEDYSKIKLQQSRNEKQKERAKGLSRIGLQPTGVPPMADRTIRGTSTTDGQIKKGRGRRQREKKRSICTVAKDQEEEIMEEVSNKKRKKTKLDDSSTLVHNGQRAIKGDWYSNRTPQPSLTSKPQSSAIKRGSRKMK